MSDAAEFFCAYADALLARDAARIAELYAVPALVLFPGEPIAVSDRAQTEAFFSSSFGQYDGVAEAEPSIDVIAESPDSLWCDVTWSYDGEPRERFVYQLVASGGDWQIAVLTPLPL